MAKRITSAQIKKMLKEGNLILGTERSIKSLRLGRVEKVLLSKNCPEKVESNVSRYSSLNGTAVEKLDLPNDELGIICKKPFSISVLALVKK